MYYPNIYARSCHLCNHPCDTASHVLNGCMSFKSMDTSRHDRTVDIIADKLRKKHHGFTIHSNKVVSDNLMGTRNTFPRLGNNKPDILLFDQCSKLCYIVEISHPADVYLETCYLNKCLKYRPLAESFRSIRYKCQVISLFPPLDLYTGTSQLDLKS